MHTQSISELAGSWKALQSCFEQERIAALTHSQFTIHRSTDSRSAAFDCFNLLLCFSASNNSRLCSQTPQLLDLSSCPVGVCCLALCFEFVLSPGGRESIRSVKVVRLQGLQRGAGALCGLWGEVDRAGWGRRWRRVHSGGVFLCSVDLFAVHSCQAAERQPFAY